MELYEKVSQSIPETWNDWRSRKTDPRGGLSVRSDTFHWVDLPSNGEFASASTSQGWLRFDWSPPAKSACISAGLVK